LSANLYNQAAYEWAWLICYYGGAVKFSAGVNIRSSKWGLSGIFYRKVLIFREYTA